MGSANDTGFILSAKGSYWRVLGVGGGGSFLCETDYSCCCVENGLEGGKLEQRDQLGGCYNSPLRDDEGLN